MTAREYLSQLKDMAKRLWILHEAIERKRARLESTTVPLKPDRVQTSGSGDSMADGVADLADRELEYEDLLWEYSHKMEEMTLRIARLDNGIYAQLLYLLYVEGRSREDIGTIMYYSPGYVSALHAKALAAFEEKYPDILNM